MISSHRAGWVVYGTYLLIGLALNRFFPFRDMDQWFRLFLWGTLLRLTALSILVISERSSPDPARLDFQGASGGRFAWQAAAMLGLWSLLLTQAHGEPWGPVEKALGVSACLVVGGFEELLFRGVLLRDLAGWLGPARASLASAFLFTIFHTRPQAVAAWPHIFLTGAVFANWRLRGASLGHLALLHAAVDAMFFFYGKEPMTGYGPVYYLFLAGLFVFAAATAPRKLSMMPAGDPT